MRAVHQNNIQTAILEAKKNNFAVLEIHFTSPQFLPQNIPTTELKKIKTFAAKNNIILQTHSDIGQSLLQTDTDVRIAEKRKLEKMVKLSRAIGARCFTVHIGKAPGYHAGPGNNFANDETYSKYYIRLFEDSIKHLISLTKKDLLICIENDNLLPVYQKVLGQYLKTKKIFLTWDIMKNCSFKLTTHIREDQWLFVKKHIQNVRNLHISGPAHASLSGYEKDFTDFFKLFDGKDLPMIMEILSLQDAVKAKQTLEAFSY